MYGLSEVIAGVIDVTPEALLFRCSLSICLFKT